MRQDEGPAVPNGAVPTRRWGQAPIRKTWLPLLALIPAILIVADIFLWMRHHSPATPPGASTTKSVGSQHKSGGSNKPSGIAGPFSTSHEDPYTVESHGVPVLSEAESYDGETPAARAAKVVRRLNDCFMNDLTPVRSVANLRQGLLTGREAEVRYVFFGYLHSDQKHETADVIVTVDPKTAKRYHSDPTTLACWWRDVIRDWLLMDQGKPPTYTVKYNRVLERLFHRLEAVNRNYKTLDARFGKALSDLIDANYADYDQLRLLYSSVPRGYDPRPDNYQPILADDGGP